MKKALLSLGTIVSAVAPVASVIACGDGDVPGHEAPYSISIQANKDTVTKADVFVDFKGFVSESYLKEIKSRIAESIVAANKDSLKYSTINIVIGDKTHKNFQPVGTSLSIDSSPLTDANKNNLDAVFNLIDTPFDNFMNQIKANKFYNQFFQKDAWQNLHHQIDKTNQDELKKTLLKYLGFESTDPNTIDFTYKIISDKYLDFTITRTNVVANPELHCTLFSNSTPDFFDFIAGDTIHISEIINDNLIFEPIVGRENYNARIFYTTERTQTFIAGSGYSNGSNDASIGSGSPQVTITQLYKITKLLLKENGYDNWDELIFRSASANKTPDNPILAALSNSASKVFAYGDNGQTFGINQDDYEYIGKNKFIIDLDKKTFNWTFSTHPKNKKQWVFGTDGHLVIEPSHEWSITIEGTYELNSAGNAIDTISALTKATATDGTNTIHIQESSAKIIAKQTINDFEFFRDK